MDPRTRPQASARSLILHIRRAQGEMCVCEDCRCVCSECSYRVLGTASVVSWQRGTHRLLAQWLPA
jgi:hypothetical protein